MLFNQSVLVQRKNLVKTTKEIADETGLRIHLTCVSPWLEIDGYIGTVHATEHAKEHLLECLQLSFMSRIWVPRIQTAQ
jgi:hypothetical protein